MKYTITVALHVGIGGLVASPFRRFVVEGDTLEEIAEKANKGAEEVLVREGIMSGDVTYEEGDTIDKHKDDWIGMGMVIDE